MARALMGARGIDAVAASGNHGNMVRGEYAMPVASAASAAASASKSSTEESFSTEEPRLRLFGDAKLEPQALWG